MTLINRLSNAALCFAICCLLLYASPVAAQPYTSSGTGALVSGASCSSYPTNTQGFASNSFIQCNGTNWIIQPLQTSATASAPYTCSSTYQGMIYYDTTANALESCNGTSWSSLSGSGGSITGTGTTNYVARWTSSSALGIGAVYDTGSLVSVGTTTTGSLLGVYGGLSIGTTYVSTAAPTNGAIIQGTVGIGTASPTSAQLSVVASTTSGSAVVANESATTGNTTALQGADSSSSGTAGYFVANSTSGYNTGVYGESDSPNGNAGKFNAAATSGINYGVYGTSSRARSERTDSICLPPTRCDVIHHGCWVGGQHP